MTTTTNVSLVYSTLQNGNIQEADITEDEQAPCVSVSDMFADQSNECLNEDFLSELKFPANNVCACVGI